MKQARFPCSWIASSQGLLAMTGRDFRCPLPVIASEAKQSRRHGNSACFIEPGRPRPALTRNATLSD
jgi:hypothetical protein